MDVGNLISGSSAFSKSNMYIWKFSVHILLKHSLKDFEHYHVSIWNKHNCMVVWTFLELPFFEIGKKTDLFQSCGHCWVFEICWHIECCTLTASSFRIWNSSTGIPSPPLDLFIVMLPKAHLTSHSRVSGSRWVTHHHGYLGHEDLFCIVLLIFLAFVFNLLIPIHPESYYSLLPWGVRLPPASNRYFINAFFWEKFITTRQGDPYGLLKGWDFISSI